MSSGPENPHPAGPDVPPDDGEGEDSLPADLDLEAVDDASYSCPDIAQRRLAGWVYLGMAGVAALVWLTRNARPVLVNDGVAAVALVLAAIGIYQLRAGWKLVVRETDALVAAATAVDFTVGHASAQLGWRGLRSRPTWRMLVYSAEEPPAKRALVLVDGVDGRVVDKLVEENPEDWATTTAQRGAGPATPVS